MPDLATVLDPSVDTMEQAVFGDAGVSGLHFEEGDEIEEGDVLGARFQDNGACEIVAPESGVLISLPYEEGDTVASVAMLAKIQPDR